MGTEGYPDWQRVVQTSADPLLYTTTASLNPTYASPAIYCGNWQSLSLRAVANLNLGGGAFFVVVSFYADQALTQLVQSLSWSTADQLPVYDSLSVLAPWCQVTTTQNGVPAGRTATIVLSPFNGGPGNRKTNAPSGMAVISSLTVAAGASASQLAGYVTSGQATISAHMTGTARVGQAFIWSYDGLGATTIVWGHSFVSGDGQDYVNDSLWLPATKLQLRVINNGANPGFFDVYLGAAS